MRGGGVERGKWLGVERGGMWWEGGGRKTKDNDVATQPTLFVSFRNVLGGLVYEVQSL